MGHGHGHGHSHGHGLGTTQGRLLAAIAVNAVILIAEAIGGWITGSLALLSDAGHNLTDVGALVLAFFAARFASLPATDRRTFGYYRLEILSALANGVILVLVSLAILYEGFRRLSAPPDIPGTLVLIIAVIGLGGNLMGAAILMRDRDQLNVHGAFLHLIADSISSVGVIIAALVVIYTGNPIADVVASVLIAVIIILSSYNLIRETIDILLQAMPRGMEMEALQTCVGDIPDVLSCHDLHVWSLTSGHHVATLHVVVPREKLPESERIIHDVTRRFHDQFGISHTTVQVEPPDFDEPGIVH